MDIGEWQGKILNAELNSNQREKKITVLLSDGISYRL